jgi:hypothetical protein
MIGQLGRITSSTVFWYWTKDSWSMSLMNRRLKYGIEHSLGVIYLSTSGSRSRVDDLMYGRQG